MKAIWARNQHKMRECFDRQERQARRNLYIVLAVITVPTLMLAAYAAWLLLTKASHL